MNKTLTKLITVALFVSIATPVLARDRDHDDDDDYRGYNAPRYYQDRGQWDDRGNRGWERGRGHHKHEQNVYYAAPYYQPPRVVYAPPPAVYYPAPVYRSGVEVRLMQLF